MPTAEMVVPGAWSDIIILYDDGEYSLIWGRFDKRKRRDLAARWNGKEGTIGYPSTRGYPQWYVEPPFLVEGILKALRSKLHEDSNYPGHKNKHLHAIEQAIRDVERYATH